MVLWHTLQVIRIYRSETTEAELHSGKCPVHPEPKRLHVPAEFSGPLLAAAGSCAETNHVHEAPENERVDLQSLSTHWKVHGQLLPDDGFERRVLSKGRNHPVSEAVGEGASHLEVGGAPQ